MKNVDTYGTGQAAMLRMSSDVLDGVLAAPPEDQACPVLTSLNGVYGPVEIKPGSNGGGGDVYADGALVYDCPNYEA